MNMNVAMDRPDPRRGGADLIIDVTELLSRAREKGARLWVQNGELHYTAPRGALTREDMNSLRRSKPQLIELLEGSAEPATSPPPLTHRPRFEEAPLAFQQLTHWNLYQLGKRPCIRQVASATRLHGTLRMDALRASVAEVVRRHDALRTRFVVRGGVPIQRIDRRGSIELDVKHLNALEANAREHEVIRQIEQLIMAPVDPAIGPLFGIRLLVLGEAEHVLILALEHMIGDARSLGILTRELLTAYAQARHGQSFELPDIQIQFADYATWQQQAHASWLERHGAYCAKRLAGRGRTRFPDDSVRLRGTERGWGIAPILLDPELKAELRDACRKAHTTPALGVLTAYVALIMRWCNVTDLVVQYQIDGRTHAETDHALGYFASVLYLRIELLDGDTFADLLGRVIREYCQAHEHADSSYMESQTPRPEFTLNTAFNWVPQPATPSEELAGLVCSPVPFEHPMLRTLERDNEPMVQLFETEESVTGGVYFPLRRFATDTIERFGRNFVSIIGDVLRQPGRRVKDFELLH